MVLELSKFVPMNRERLLHIGILSYARKIKGKKDSLPRAINFTAVFYTAGLPPEFLGIASTIASLTQSEKELFSRVYPNLVSQLNYSAPYFNEENLLILSHKWPHLRKVCASVKKFAAENGIKLGPRNSEQILHRNHISNAVQHYFAGDYKLFVSSLVKAGKCRHALG